MNLWDKVGKLTLVISVVSLIIAVLISMAEVETIVGSGPAIGCIGVLLFLTALFRKAKVAVWCGVSLPVLALTVFGIIWFADWSPNEARLPVPAIAAGFTLPYVYFALKAYRLWPRQDEPWRCSGCGYALVGLDGHACPECGWAYDPSQVPDQLPPDARLDS